MVHPNKSQFMGILTFLDIPSDVPPSGARGHRIVISKKAAMESLDTLIGMGINHSPDFSRHAASSKIGIIESAEIVGNEVFIYGYLFKKDCAGTIDLIQSMGDFGMSYEIMNAHVEDMRSEIWRLNQLIFSGASIMKREKAAYKMTDFVILN